MKREVFMEVFKQNVLTIRKLNNLTQQQFADKVGLKRCSVGAIEELRALSFETVEKVSRAFGYSMDELVTTSIISPPLTKD